MIQAIFAMSDSDQRMTGYATVNYSKNSENETVVETTEDMRMNDFEIIVGGNTEFSDSENNTAYQGRTVDVSTYDGSTSVEIGLAGDDDSGRETLVSDIQMSI
jgi:hypothetical protein